VTVAIEHSPGRLALCIADDGVGFDAQRERSADASAPHLGLLGMQERIVGLGGRLRIVSARATGCRIEADIPLPSVDPVVGDDDTSADF
jgi:signal transduction histidine kinase